MYLDVFKGLGVVLRLSSICLCEKTSFVCYTYRVALRENRDIFK